MSMHAKLLFSDIISAVLIGGACVAAVAAVAGPACAADLPRQMVTKAPVYPAPYDSWTGFYVGLNGGGGWGSSSWSTSVLNDFNVSGGMVGGTIGYNWQHGSWVLGLEGDLDWANISSSGTSILCPAGCASENTWLGTARGRLGYAFDRWMPYVTAGAAFGDVKAIHPGFVGATNTQLGWTIGGGVEYAVARNWTAKVEYLHYDLGNFNCGVACSGFATDTVSFSADAVRGGINYRF
jgi:outer membrane immunogenic protein